MIENTYPQLNDINLEPQAESLKRIADALEEIRSILWAMQGIVRPDRLDEEGLTGGRG